MRKTHTNNIAVYKSIFIFKGHRRQCGQRAQQLTAVGRGQILRAAKQSAGAPTAIAAGAVG